MKKTENTLENKAKFFALYYKQRVLKTIDYEHESVGNYLLTLSNPFMSLIENDKGIYFLELSPLSQITDEDARIIGFNSDDLTEEDADFGMSPSGIFLEQYELSPELLQSDADYLRLKGYALPFLDLSVEDLVEYGWVKIKS